MRNEDLRHRKVYELQKDIDNPEADGRYRYDVFRQRVIPQGTRFQASVDSWEVDGGKRVNIYRLRVAGEYNNLTFEEGAKLWPPLVAALQPVYDLESVLVGLNTSSTNVIENLVKAGRLTLGDIDDADFWEVGT